MNVTSCHISSTSSNRFLPPDEGQRATLSQAVYEEWYFARRQQIHARKVKAREKIRQEEEMKAMVIYMSIFFLFHSVRPQHVIFKRYRTKKNNK